jgi:thioredoxin 1
MPVLKTTSENFKKDVLEHQGVVLVDFYADWCGPCRMMGPIIDELSEEIKEVKFVKVNVDENSELASSHQIFSIPTLIIFKNGQVVGQFVGVIGKENLKQELNKHISSNN